MTYSRQQRERAVDLYIKYEHSAADVIHELGYPSRTILYVWYREQVQCVRSVCVLLHTYTYRTGLILPRKGR